MINNNKYNIIASNIAPNPVSAKYWADLNEDPSGNVVKTYNGTKWTYVNSAVLEDLKRRLTELENYIYQTSEVL